MELFLLQIPFLFIQEYHELTYCALLPGIGKYPFSQQRFYSTKNTSVAPANVRAKNEFWRKVNSRDILDNENPFVIVNNFLKDYPKLAEDPILAKEVITLELITSILCINNFHLTQEEFDFLLSIKPSIIESPIKDKEDLLKLAGNCSDNRSPGVYVFKHKVNGFRYVGSSICLTKRLSNGYFKSKLGSRKIELAIKEYGLDSFSLYLYILPQVDTIDIKNWILVLEQILILYFNPEYNILKVVGSAPMIGRNHSELTKKKWKAVNILS